MCGVEPVESPCRCGRDRYSDDGECAACPGAQLEEHEEHTFDVRVSINAPSSNDAAELLYRAFMERIHGHVLAARQQAQLMSVALVPPALPLVLCRMTGARADHIADTAEAIRTALESRTVLLRDGITQGRIHPAWIGPIAWELAEAAVDALPVRTYLSAPYI